MPKVYHAAQQHATQLPLFVLTKTCTLCKKEKGFNEFRKAVSGRDGYNARCIQCVSDKEKQKRKEINAEHPEALTCIDCSEEKPFSDFLKRRAEHRCSKCRELLRQEYQHQHYLAHKEEKLIRCKQYRDEHKEQYHGYWLKKKNDPEERRKRNERARRYNRTEQRRVYNRAYLHRTRTGNPKWQEYGRQRSQRPDVREKRLQYLHERGQRPEFKEYKRQYRAAHPEQEVKQAERKRLNYAANPEIGKHINAMNIKWRAEHPGQLGEQSRRRYARQRHATVQKVSYRKILERDGHHCYICDKPILPHHKMHFDHVIPIAKHGHHVEDNIKPTHACCNMRKNARLLEDMTPFDRRGPDN